MLAGHSFHKNKEYSFFWVTWAIGFKVQMARQDAADMGTGLILSSTAMHDMSVSCATILMALFPHSPVSMLHTSDPWNPSYADSHNDNDRNVNVMMTVDCQRIGRPTRGWEGCRGRVRPSHGPPC